MLVRCALYNARRMAKAEYKRKPNWVLAMELFGVGSTYAHEYCKAAEVDPDGLAFQLWPNPSHDH
jgi:hypothetical protein